MSNNAVLGKAFAQWCARNRIPKPTTRAGLEVLFAQFMNQQPDTQEVLGAGANHYEIHDTHETHLVNDGSTVQVADPAPQGIYKSDWDELLENRGKAAIGPNGELLDDFDQEFELLNKQRADQAATAPPTNTNPPSSATAILGGQTPFVTTAQPQELARWVGDDGETTPVTVTIAPYNVQNPRQEPFSFRNYAIVQFGTRGFLSTVEVDVSRGCQFTVSGSSVIVQVATEGTALFTTGLQSPPLVAMLSFNQIVRTSKLTRTKWVATNDAHSGVFSIPPFAKTLEAVWINSPGTLMTITFLGPEGANVGSVTIPSSAVSYTTPVAIPTDATYAEIGSDNTTQMQIIFGLSV